MKTQLSNQLGFPQDMACRELRPLLHTQLATGLLAIVVGSAALLCPTAGAQQPAGTVVAWGWNGEGECNVPSGLSGVIAIAGGGEHSLALKQDRTVVAWGYNGCGECNVPRGLSGVIAIAAGQLHSLALKQDGTVVAWGDNGYGECSVPSGLSGVIAISAGGMISLALKQDGTVVSWGKIWNGHNAWIPETVPSGLSAVIAIAAGYAHSMALKQDGTVVAWGDSGSAEDNVPSGLSGVIAIGAADSHSLALKQDGTVVSWGETTYGECNVPSGLRGVIAIAAGEYYSLALKQDGTVVAWGDNSSGQATVPTRLSGVIAIAAGGSHSLALKQDGTVVAWGANGVGQATVPPDLSGSGVVAVAAALAHSMALVGPLAPIIVEPPQTQTAEAGSTSGLYVVADGVPPLIYQWFFDSTNAVSGATNSFLVLANAQPSQSGDSYAVVITNRYGAVTSDTATLSIIAPVPRRTVPALYLTGDVGSFLRLSYADTPGLGGASWQALDALTLTNTPQLCLDLSDPLPPYRFYRAWQTNVPSLKPALDLGRATEITLTGAIGSKVRIDYINQFGPTDAWVTLDTVTLTNTTQPYFDLTMFRQAPRLYRVVPVLEAIQTLHPVSLPICPKSVVVISGPVDGLLGIRLDPVSTEDQNGPWGLLGADPRSSDGHQAPLWVRSEETVGLTADQAGTLARQLANETSQSLYHCQPFRNGQPARFVQGRWLWREAARTWTC